MNEPELDFDRLYKAVFRHQPGLKLVELSWWVQKQLGQDPEFRLLVPWWLVPLDRSTTILHEWGWSRVMRPWKENERKRCLAHFSNGKS